jgi:hypothetical protein
MFCDVTRRPGTYSTCDVIRGILFATGTQIVIGILFPNGGSSFFVSNLFLFGGVATSECPISMQFWTASTRLNTENECPSPCLLHLVNRLHGRSVSSPESLITPIRM